MSRDGSGNYALPAGNPVVNGTTISSTVQNNTMTDVATALTASLCADGQKTATANQPMGGFKHTSVGDATARTQYPSTGQVQDGALIAVGSVAGTDTYTGSLSPAHVSFTAGQTIIFKPGSTNTGASTLALNGGTAKSITKNSVALVAGDLVSGTPAILVYTGTAWNLTNPYSTGTLSASIFLAGDGAVGAPSFSFTSDPDTGFYRSGSGTVQFSSNGTQIFQMSGNGISAIAAGAVFFAQDGSTGAPPISFGADPDTGIYRVGANDLGLSVAGTLGAHLTTADFEIVHATIPKIALYVGGSERAFFRYTEASATARVDSDSTLEFATNNTVAVSILAGGQTQFVDGVIGTPAISFISDTNTGLYRIGADSFGITAGGALQFWVDNTSSVPVRSELIHGFNVGSVSNPGITWAVDNDTGIYHRTGNAITFTANGTLAMEVQNAATYFLDGSVGLPGIAFFNDADNGLYRIGTNDWGLSAAGALVLEILSGQAKYLTFEVGFREIPQNSKSIAYTTVLADSGKHIYHPSADTTARTWTIDSNANVAYPIGTAITFINDTSGGVITIAITSDTLVFAGPGTTGSRSLAANGMATAVKMTATRWMISGTGLT